MVFVVGFYWFASLPTGEITSEQVIRILLRSGLFLDDAFYYFKVASNFLGFGLISFDLINLTNGFHPLWLLTILPIVNTLSPQNFLMTVCLIQFCLYFGAALILSRLAQQKGFAQFFYAIITISLFTFTSGLRASINGLETSLHLFLLAYSSSALQKYIQFGRYRALLFLMPLLFLTRVDSVIFIATSFLAIYLIERKFSRPFIHMISAVSATVACYVLFNFYFMGLVSPVSGSAKITYASFVHTEQSLNNTQLDLWLSYLFIAIKEPWVLSALILNSIALLFYFKSREVVGSALSLYCIIKYFLYVFLYKAAAVSFLWYFIPDLFAMIYFINWLTNKYVRSIYVLLVISLLCLISAAHHASQFYNNMRHHANLVKHHRLPHVGNELDMFFLSALLVNKLELPKAMVLGMHNSGVFGFFSNHRVVNMDGLINGTVRLGYIKKYGYDWLPYIDEQQHIDGYLDLVATVSLKSLADTLQARGFTLVEPLQMAIESSYGAPLIDPTVSQMFFAIRPIFTDH